MLFAVGLFPRAREAYEKFFGSKDYLTEIKRRCRHNNVLGVFLGFTKSKLWTPTFHSITTICPSVSIPSEPERSLTTHLRACIPWLPSKASGLASFLPTRCPSELPSLSIPASRTCLIAFVCSRARRRKAATTSRALLAAELGQFQPGAAHR